MIPRTDDGPTPQTFQTFWHGAALPPVHWACLESFLACGHRVVVYAYGDLRLPAGARLADANDVLPASELFAYQESFSAFSNVFRYALLLERGGWWIDTDVRCLGRPFPDCRYAWAEEGGGFINGAILKFPAGDPVLAAVLADARRVGRDVHIQGQLGPRLLTTHLAARQWPGHFGSTRAFYPLHWLDAHRLWTPEDRAFVEGATASAHVLHLWATTFRYLGLDETVAPPAGSYLHGMLDRASLFDRLRPARHDDAQRARESVRAWLAPRLGYDVDGHRFTAAAASSAPTVGVVIPAFQAAWCLERAVASCLAQTYPPCEVLIIDDRSADETLEVASRLAAGDARIRVLPLDAHAGHLAAVSRGLDRSSADWIALLDADDELTPDSLEQRLAAAQRFEAAHREPPALVYGDLYRNRRDVSALTRFKALEGDAFPFLSRELSLCQTSTIMLGRRALRHFPRLDNPYNTDDEIVVAVGQHGPVVHAGAPVAVAHDHDRPSRMSNSAEGRYRGVACLVRHHRDAIRRQHGHGQLLLWRLRVVRAALEWHAERLGAPNARPARFADRIVRYPLQMYAALAARAHAGLTSYLQARFEQLYF